MNFTQISMATCLFLFIIILGCVCAVRGVATIEATEATEALASVKNLELVHDQQRGLLTLPYIFSTWLRTSL